MSEQSYRSIDGQKNEHTDKQIKRQRANRHTDGQRKIHTYIQMNKQEKQMNIDINIKIDKHTDSQSIYRHTDEWTYR